MAINNVRLVRGDSPINLHFGMSIAYLNEVTSLTTIILAYTLVEEVYYFCRWPQTQTGYCVVDVSPCSRVRFVFNEIAGKVLEQSKINCTQVFVI